MIVSSRQKVLFQSNCKQLGKKRREKSVSSLYFQCVLHFMVGSTEGADGVSRDIIEVLLTSGLMKE